jgi:hypothetical protein
MRFFLRLHLDEARHRVDATIECGKPLPFALRLSKRSHLPLSTHRSPSTGLVEIASAFLPLSPSHALSGPCSDICMGVQRSEVHFAEITASPKAGAG